MARLTHTLAELGYLHCDRDVAKYRVGIRALHMAHPLPPKHADDQALQDALKPLLGRIDLKTMQQANLRASNGDAESSSQAVARWLWEQIAQKK